MSETPDIFDADFEALTGHGPFPWQRRLFEAMRTGEWPDAVDVPTGIGKTAAVACWLLALAGKPEAVPRRLVYVVNRRTIVDQVTDIVARMAAALDDLNDARLDARRRALAALSRHAGDESDPKPGEALVVSTLRGELADNGAWRRDPARPAIIVGTPDMIGSALLFRAYRASWKSRAFHAGLLGQDVLVLHDEAHLTRPFQALLERVRVLQETNHRGNVRNLRVLALSATGDDSDGNVIRLSEADHADETVERRVNARKTLRLHPAGKVPDAVAVKAAEFADEPVKVLVYLRSPKDAATVRAKLVKQLGKSGDKRVNLLTGTIRGRERDRLTKTDVMRRLRHDDAGLPSLERAVYLVSTSAGEVGADLDADHLVCDLVPADSLVQRLGRVNRRGESMANTQVHVFPAATNKGRLAEATAATGDLLRELGADGEAGIDAGPLATRPWVTDATRSPSPEVTYLDERQLSALTMTSLRGDWSLVPDVPKLIHGLENDLPQTTLVWRDEADLLAGSSPEEVEAIFTKHRPLAHERLTASTGDVAKFVQARLAAWQEKRRNEHESDEPPYAVLRDVQGEWKRVQLDNPSLLDRPNPNPPSILRHAMLILPAHFGGLDKKSGSLDHASNTADDVADMRDEPYQRARAILNREPNGDWTYRYLGDGDSTDETFDKRSDARRNAADAKSMRVAEEFIIAKNAEDDTPIHVLVLLKPKRTGSGKDSKAVTYDEHIKHVVAYAARFAGVLLPELKTLYHTAAMLHDSGKRRDRWQQAAGRREDDPVIAKSAGYAGVNWRILDGYRHEFGSAWDICIGTEEVPPDVDRDLLLHLILSHHGLARPAFLAAALRDPEHGDMLPDELKPAAVASRFVRLQRKYGPWRLAWLESIFRAADQAASAEEQGGDDDTE